jgi:hypothetical protein
MEDGFLAQVNVKVFSISLMLDLYHSLMLHCSSPKNQSMKEIACNTVDLPLKHQALEHVSLLLPQLNPNVVLGCLFDHSGPGRNAVAIV